jgi:hypothetical protein
MAAVKSHPITVVARPKSIASRLECLLAVKVIVDSITFPQTPVIMAVSYNQSRRCTLSVDILKRLGEALEELATMSSVALYTSQDRKDRITGISFSQDRTSIITVY